MVFHIGPMVVDDLHTLGRAGMLLSLTSCAQQNVLWRTFKITSNGFVISLVL